MNKINSVIIFLILFIIAAVLLSITGFFDFSSLEILASVLMLSGMASVYSSFGEDKKGLLFIGTSVFLIGIMVFINARFELENTKALLLPAVLLISGTGFFILFIDENSDKIFLILSVVLILSGVLYVVFFRNSRLDVFLKALWILMKSYWFIFLLVAGLIIVLRKS